MSHHAPVEEPADITIKIGFQVYETYGDRGTATISLTATEVRDILDLAEKVKAMEAAEIRHWDCSAEYGESPRVEIEQRCVNDDSVYWSAALKYSDYPVTVETDWIPLKALETAQPGDVLDLRPEEDREEEDADDEGPRE